MLKAIIKGTLSVSFVLAAGTAAANFPERPVTIIVPFTAGTATDTMTRIVAQAYSERLGQPVIVENRPGADGAIGAVEVARANPDGYKLLMSTNGFSAVPTMRKVPPYEPTEDFTPISLVGRYTFFLYVNSEVPVTSVNELTRYSKENPGQLNYATGNPTGIVATGQMMSVTGADMVHIPYKGEPAGITDLIANRVQVMFATPTTADQYVESGMLRSLATTLPERSPDYPEIPTMEEAGVKGFAVPSWAALQGPKGMDPAVIERLNQELVAVLDDTAVQEQLAKQKFLPDSSTPNELTQFIQSQIALYAKTLKEAGVEPQ